MEQVVLDFGWQFKEVHYLCHSGPRNPFSRRDFGLAKRGVIFELPAPRPGQFEWIRSPWTHCGAFVMFARKVL